MRNFLIRVIQILSFTFIILLSIEILFREIPNSYSIKILDLEYKQVDKLEGIYFGSSHSFLGINPEYSKINSINLANVSQSIDLDKEIFDRKINYFKNLKTVFIEISYFSLGSRTEEGMESWRKNIYDYYLRNNPYILLSRFPSPKTSIKSIIKYYIRGKTVDINSYGHQIRYEKITNNNLLKQDSKIASLRHFNELSGRNKIIYFEFINLLLSNDISVVVHVPPVTKDYKEVFDINQRIFVESFLSDLRNRFDRINVLDNSSLFVDRYDLFYDSDHLNSKGAEEYTKFLNRFIE